MVEIAIGTKDKPNLLNKSIMGSVLHFDSFYILHMITLPVIFYVYDKSEEGIELSKFIKISIDTHKQIEEKGIELLLKYANVEDFFTIINEHYKVSFDCGYKNAQADIREALGIKKIKG